MQRLRTIAVVGAILTICAVPFAFAGGLWFGLPVVGGASYCAGATATGVAVPSGGTTSCNVTAPAGPTSTTGNELIPSDLNTSGTPGVPGQQNTGSPQTAYLPLVTAASGAYLLTNPGTFGLNATVTIPAGISNVVVNNTGTNTTLAFLMPTPAFDGQVVHLSANATITTVFVTAGTPTSSNVASVQTPTKLLAGFVPYVSPSNTGTFGAAYLYNLSGNTWYRVQ